MNGSDSEDTTASWESETSRRRFLTASILGAGALAVGWNLNATADESRRHTAAESPLSPNESNRWAGLLEDDSETEPDTETSKKLTRTQYPLLEGTAHETPVYVIDAPHDGPTAFVVGGMHGDERSGYRAASEITTWGIKRGQLVVLPAANKIALKKNTRTGEHGDLNRQFPSREGRDPTTELAQAIWATVDAHNPDWLVDLHSSSGVYGSGDGGVGQAIFPSHVPPAERYAGRVAKTVNAQFDLSGSMRYKRGNTVSRDRGMLAARASNALDIPAFILETTRKLDIDIQTKLHTTSMDAFLRLFQHG